MSYCQGCADRDARIAALEAQAREDAELLRRLEWRGIDYSEAGTHAACPACGGIAGDREHRVGCRLAARLARRAVKQATPPKPATPAGGETTHD